MSDKKQKLQAILDAVKLKVENLTTFEKEVDTILEMFNAIKDINTENVSANLIKRKIKLEDLRADKAVNWNFRMEMRGKYFEVPNVSKK